MLSSDFEIVATENDSEGAVRAAGLLRPDIVILDIEMPKLDGFAVARRLSAIDPRPRIVFLTAYADVDYLDAALRVGALGYVLKARAAEDLVRAIHSALRGEQFISAGAGSVRRSIASSV